MSLSQRPFHLPSLIYRTIWPNLQQYRQFQTLHPLQKNYRDSRRGEGLDSSIRQKRVGSQLRAVLCKELQSGPYRDELLQNCGFSIHAVKMSDDLKRAHILWSAFEGHHKEAEKYLHMYMPRLRSAVFAELNLPFSPNLNFCKSNSQHENQMRAFEDAFEMIKNES